VYGEATGGTATEPSQAQQKRMEAVGKQIEERAARGDVAGAMALAAQLQQEMMGSAGQVPQVIAPTDTWKDLIAWMDELLKAAYWTRIEYHGPSFALF
jgi:hypothetical protein